MKRSVLKKMLTVLLVLTVCLSECMVSQASQKKTTSEAAFAAKLKRGWNLGNTLDATGSRDLTSETSWGQPKTTKQLIDYVHACGFTSIRIPVSWSNHIDRKDQINPEWMSRVQEVVDAAVGDGMYVIIDSHHDNDCYYPSEKKLKASEKYISTIWTQIAEHFRSYDEHLIFEGMNEPRLAGTGKEWWFADNDPEGIAAIACVMQLNQTFVNTVRAAGGKNTTRYLMVPSVCASAQNALNAAFSMPDDPAGRTMLSVHAYTPYDFAMNSSGGYSKWNGSHDSDLDFFRQLNEKFVQKGTAVVIGKFGATNKGNLQERVKWAKDYLARADKYKIPCFWWDNGAVQTGDENFGLINRQKLTVYSPKLLKALQTVN